jgi:hypothetical protein
VVLKAGTNSAAKIVLKGKGSALRMPSLPLTAPLTVQLGASNGECWQAVYSKPITNTADQFKAKAD